MRQAIGLILAIMLALGAWLLLTSHQDAPPPVASDSTSEHTLGDAATAISGVAGDQQPTTPDAVSRDERTAAEASATPAAPRMRVRVLDADHHAIENASLETFDDTTPGTVSTDQKGWATVGVAPGAGQVRMLVRAGNRHRQALFGRSRELTVTLPWAGALHGRLVDQLTGAPVADAEVTRKHDNCQKCEPDRARTAVDGTFELPDVPRAEDCGFTFTAAHYPQQSVRMRIPGTGDALEHTFRMVRGELIAGRCVDLETRQPVANAKVTHEGEALATAGADGSFHVLVLPSEDHTTQLRFEATGYCRTTHAVPTPQPDNAIEYVMLRAAGIAGRVHTATGSPIEGARLRVMQQSEHAPEGLPKAVHVDDAEDYMAVKSAADGSFRIGGLVPGSKYRVAASHTDYARMTGENRWGVEAKAATEAPVIDLVLQPKPGLTGGGTIVGRYRLNGEVEAARLRWKSGERDEGAPIGEDGTFRIEHVPAGTVTLTAQPDRFQSWMGEPNPGLQLRREVALHEGEELKVELEQTIVMAAITGHVTEADGAPAIDRWLWARNQAQRFGAHTDENGDYSMPVPTCVATVSVNCSGKERADVHPGDTGIDFVAPRTGKLLLRVQAEDGTPVEPDVSVRVNGEKYFRQNQVAAPDPDGYRETSVPPGTLTLVVAASNFTPCIQTAAVGDETRLDITMLRGTTVRVRLAEGTAPPARDISFGLIDSDLLELDVRQRWMVNLAVERWFRPTRDGYTLQNVSSGRHRLVASDPKLALVPDTIDVGTTPATVELTWHLREK